MPVLLSSNLDDRAPKSHCSDFVSLPRTRPGGPARAEPSGDGHSRVALFKFPSNRGSPTSMLAKEITIELDNMDVVLSVSTASAGSVLVGSRMPQSTTATSFGNAIPQDIGSTNVAQCLERLAQPRDARRTEYLVPGSFLNDPVVERLVRALDAAEQSTGNFDDVYADAVRLAIVTRLLSLRSESSRNTETARNKVALPTWRLKRVIEYVNSRYMDTITLANLASAVGLSRMHFAAQFRLATGIRPHEFVLRHRIERSQKLLAETGETLVNIALSVGFQSQSHFTTVFRRYVGDTPHRWRCRNGSARRQQKDRNRIAVEPVPGTASKAGTGIRDPRRHGHDGNRGMST